ncbi:hypothetical protein BKA66DRAFT_585215 [Pyrenochaeta sp. MPI-SDFR-AT-0127]|nr:hypothetical protein BKA66DRAFT_585215 [Pyrenochaeta sp. MPI-SDFR-AT-0127]
MAANQVDFLKTGLREIAVGEIPRGNSECTICLHESLSGTSVIQILSCEHVFHRQCLLAWLNSCNAKHSHCPNCRLELFPTRHPAFPRFDHMRPIPGLGALPFPLHYPPLRSAINGITTISTNRTPPLLSGSPHSNYSLLSSEDSMIDDVLVSRPNSQISEKSERQKRSNMAKTKQKAGHLEQQARRFLVPSFGNKRMLAVGQKCDQNARAPMTGPAPFPRFNQPSLAEATRARHQVDGSRILDTSHQERSYALCSPPRHRPNEYNETAVNNSTAFGAWPSYRSPFRSPEHEARSLGVSWFDGSPRGYHADDLLDPEYLRWRRTQRQPSILDSPGAIAARGLYQHRPLLGGGMEAPSSNMNMFSSFRSGGTGIRDPLVFSTEQIHQRRLTYEEFLAEVRRLDLGLDIQREAFRLFPISGIYNSSAELDMIAQCDFILRLLRHGEQPTQDRSV